MPDKTGFKNGLILIIIIYCIATRDDDEALAFIKRLIEHLQPVPGNRMHDVACGKGRHSSVLNAVKCKLLARVVSVVNNQKEYVKKAA